MEKLGKIALREIYDISVVEDQNWWKQLPKNNWIAFTINTVETVQLVPLAARRCIQKRLVYGCSTGECAEIMYNFFDMEFHILAKSPTENNDINESIMTSTHENFSEGLWTASSFGERSLAHCQKVICLDFTERRVKQHIQEVIIKTNEGWIPSDEEVENPKFDREA